MKIPSEVSIVTVPGVKVIVWLSKPISAVPTDADSVEVILEKFGISPTVAAAEGVAGPTQRAASCPIYHAVREIATALTQIRRAP